MPRSSIRSFLHRSLSLVLMPFYIMLFAWISLAGCGTSAPQEMIFFGGTVLTMSDAHPGKVEAVLVRDGKIAALGSRDEILGQKTPATRLVDLEGRTLMPGLIAVHTHPDLAAFLHGFVDLSGFTCKSPDEVWERVRRAVRETKKGDWIFCRGFDPMLVRGLSAPDIALLDSLAPDNPLTILAQSMHSAWANSAAFAKMGITASTPDPAPGSFYEKDASGRLTGFIVETEAIRPFNAEVLKAFNIKQNILEVLKNYLANGFTSITTMGMYATDSKPFLLYEHLSTRHPRLVHRLLAFAGMLPERVPMVRHFMYIKHDTPFLIPDSVENGDDFFKVSGIKLWYDGSPYTGSMYIREPYLDSELMRKGLKIPSRHTGEPVIDRQVFFENIRKYHEAGWQLSVHSQGDRSTDEVLDVFEKVIAAAPANTARHRLEHGLLLPPELLGKMKRFNMTPSFHINHLYYYGEALRNDIIGPARAGRMLPAADAQKNGLVISLHADQPMYPEEPFSLLQTAVTRETREGMVIGGAHAIPVIEGLKALTIYSAWQLNMEKKIGSIEAGKYADLVVLDRNPLAVPASQLGSVRVMKTYVAGDEAWSR